MESHTLLAVLFIVLQAVTLASCLRCQCNEAFDSCVHNVEECDQPSVGFVSVCYSLATKTLVNVSGQSGSSSMLEWRWLVRYGCASKGASGSGRSHLSSNVQCTFHKPGSDGDGGVVGSCCETDFCNNQLKFMAQLPSLPRPVVTAAPQTQDYTEPSELELSSSNDTIVVAVAVLGSLVVVGGICAILLARHRSKRPSKKPTLLPTYKKPCHPTTMATKPDVFVTEVQMDSGVSLGESSGRGVFQLEQRTVSREITLISRIGNGRFGEVYRGEWRGNDVAVKIFKTMDEDSFFREVELFNTNMLRHENIVGFQAADNLDCSMETQLWMVLDYHSSGSLFDYLRHHTAGSPHPHSSLNIWEALRLASSAASGLAHLHLHIGGSNSFQMFGHKPSIAHRDLKSKNILVKSTGVCCIADLGMAVREGPEWDDLKCITHANLRTGTRRYMAPEVLDGTIDIGAFHSFRQVDVYSLAIVLWEILSSCHLAGGKEPCYQLPYESLVPGDPSVDDMFKVVCNAGLRPTIPEQWKTYEELREISTILKSCWRAKPSSRLPAQNVAKKLGTLLQTAATKCVNVPTVNSKKMEYAISPIHKPDA
ncbi:TGF-beta receptor type-1-like [Sycon ciliatum]|uniref:TGF-beta receptor type-1-like n=1 Tax=Sycon ciliatum TaxID=27933 RepID=UPI0020AB7B3D|eukprot:scpid36103/ scgid4823/ TGF-beta receptor type-1; Serine/threonine-protein kinase receptor R4; TGF-beta type I receptor; Transforming growth factor-beta receptor type I